MKKPIILVLLSLIAYSIIRILEFSNAGMERYYVWDKIANEIWMELFVILVGILIGFFIALIPFSRITFPKRAAYSISTLFFIYCCYASINLFIYYHGLTESSNYFTAKDDLAKGIVHYQYAGQLRSISNRTDSIIEALQRSYGFEMVDVGIVTPGMLRYNEAVDEYLNKRNPKDWSTALDQKIDSVIKQHVLLGLEDWKYTK